VRGAYWDEECTVWRVITASGEEYEADAVISAVGVFNDLNWPDIPGLDTFKGTVFHSARWDHNHDLTGKRVGVIGSAASAVQFIPEIAPVVAQLDVYQRTANWVAPKEDAPFTAEQIERFTNDPIAARQQRWAIWRRVESAITYSDKTMMKAAEDAGRRNIALVNDPELQRKLTPSVPYGSQRPLISNKYYPTFNRDNVELVTEHIDHVTADAIVTVDGVERKVDTIILGTGFDTSKFLSAIDVTGRGGRQLADVWSNGARAYLGITTAGFPNLFMLYGPNTNNGSIIFMLECQVAYIMRQLLRMDDENILSIDIRPDVMDKYNEEIQRDCNAIDVWQVIDDSYYRAAGRIVTQWPHTMSEYRRRILQPDPEVYEVNYGTALNSPALLS
jgi:cation diffusion facilitator CzcD-associated flavoprotein CzcO